ncbi:nicotinate mononucleotide-dependent phosphoribosyltransferase CobT [Cyanobium sp. Morenito 9A2]|uniref:nicotinate mononucleotide-dependent phosphoribosyltransferase CobT n=1 Tax=Cyanobium sp. Morenito 9A2 TaxID=2823718 RepID=UPI0020CCD34A|nr:TIGR00303 family protein [Cyanobium sp. Morenito 9A2]MCP9848270.1 TIGR00303 family protein [Cyanobium sp. Morenito 9A2]
MGPRQLSGDPALGNRWCARVGAQAESSRVLLLLAGTDTSAVEGISAAGSSAVSRRFTAAADAELLLLGPEAYRPHALPPLPAGVSPALISQVVCAGLGLDPLVIDLGAPISPAVPHVQVLQAPARCLSTGSALDPAQVQRLLALGRRWGRRPSGAPLVLAECVPGGTSTAQALLTGLGIAAEGLVSGSLREPAHRLKAELVERGLRAAALDRASVAPGGAVDPLAVVAAVGDAMQVLAAALVLAAAQQGRPVLLAGGSQMAAVLALALALAPAPQRPQVAEHVVLGTTAWVASEPHSDLALLLERIGQHWGVMPLAFSAGLRFGACRHQALRDYEDGYVKEGVGAGGLALLWELSGRSTQALAAACDRACGQLLGGT